MLRALADPGQLELVDVVLEELVEREREAALERRGRGQAGPQGDVAREDGIEALHPAAALEDLAADAEDIAGPGFRGLVLFVQAEGGGGVVIDGMKVDAGAAVGLDLGDDAFVDGAGEDVAAVVVGVLTDEVDPAGCGEHRAAVAVGREETFVDSGLQVHNYGVLKDGRMGKSIKISR